MCLPVLHLPQPRAPPRNHHGRRPPATTKPSLAELALKMEPEHSNEAPLPLNFISNRCNEKRPNWLLSSLAPAAAYLPFRHRPLPLSLPPPRAPARALPLNRARTPPRASCAPCRPPPASCWRCRCLSVKPPSRCWGGATVDARQFSICLSKIQTIVGVSLKSGRSGKSPWRMRMVLPHPVAATVDALVALWCNSF